MAEYIEREALLKHLRECEGTPPEIGYTYPIFKALECFVEDVPAADVAPVVHGRWVQVICHVEFEDGFVDRLYECCSRCHKPNGRKTSDYCPNCGARMDGE